MDSVITQLRCQPEQAIVSSFSIKHLPSYYCRGILQAWSTYTISWLYVKEVILNNMDGLHPISWEALKSKTECSQRRNSASRLQHRFLLTVSSLSTCLSDFRLASPQSCSQIQLVLVLWRNHKDTGTSCEGELSQDPQGRGPIFRPPQNLCFRDTGYCSPNVNLYSNFKFIWELGEDLKGEYCLSLFLNSLFMISHVTYAACIPFLLSDGGMLNCKYKNDTLV